MRLRTLVLAAVGAVMLAGMGSTPAFADPWRHGGRGHGGWGHQGWGHDGWRGHGWHHGWGGGPRWRRYYGYRPPVVVPPPVYRYYGPPAYAYGYAPPVVTFGFGFN